MKHALASLLVMGMLVLGAIAPAFAQQQYPNVANLTPFSVDANYMSLPGYLRWVVYQLQNAWISLEEATRIVQEQTKSAGL
jgi:hypothetical protein